MKYQFQVAIAILVLVGMSLLSVPAYATGGTGARRHTQTYHNRTPRARTRGGQSHHG